LTSTEGAAGNVTTATVLDGTSSAGATVSVNFTPAGAFAAGSGGTLVSDIVDFHGTGTDMFVLQISYNAAALAAGQTEMSLFLQWLDPGGSWENAVLGNTDIPGGQSNDPTEIFGAYDPDTDFQLGYYGVDTADQTVWAVVDHNSEFAAGGLEATPEPGTWAMLALGALILALTHKRKLPAA